MPYHIKRYSYNQAKKYDVSIYPSTKPNKKIDVYDIFKAFSLCIRISFKTPACCANNSILYYGLHDRTFCSMEETMDKWRKRVRTLVKHLAID